MFVVIIGIYDALWWYCDKYDACDEYYDIYEACDEYYEMHIMPVIFGYLNVKKL
jgi:hypothetical protein